MENKALADLLIELVNEGFEVSFYPGFYPGTITFRMEKDNCKSVYTFSPDEMDIFPVSADRLISNRISERRNDFLEYLSTHPIH